MGEIFSWLFVTLLEFAFNICRNHATCLELAYESEGAVYASLEIFGHADISFCR